MIKRIQFFEHTCSDRRIWTACAYKHAAQMAAIQAPQAVQLIRYFRERMREEAIAAVNLVKFANRKSPYQRHD